MKVSIVSSFVLVLCSVALAGAAMATPPIVNPSVTLGDATGQRGASVAINQANFTTSSQVSAQIANEASVGVRSWTSYFAGQRTTAMVGANMYTISGFEINANGHLIYHPYDIQYGAWYWGYQAVDYGIPNGNQAVVGTSSSCSIFTHGSYVGGWTVMPTGVSAFGAPPTGWTVVPNLALCMAYAP